MRTALKTGKICVSCTGLISTIVIDIVIAGAQRCAMLGCTNSMPSVRGFPRHVHKIIYRPCRGLSTNLKEKEHIEDTGTERN